MATIALKTEVELHKKSVQEYPFGSNISVHTPYFNGDVIDVTLYRESYEGEDKFFTFKLGDDEVKQLIDALTEARAELKVRQKQKAAQDARNGYVAAF